MTLPPDILAFFAVILRGLQLAVQAFLLGGILFVLGVARPMAPRFGIAAKGLEASGLRWIAVSAAAQGLVAALTIVLGMAQLVEGLGLTTAQAEGADFVGWNAAMAAASAAIAAIVLLTRGPVQRAGMVGGALVVLATSVLSSHAFARLDDRAFLMVADALHQAGAGLWIGGIPFLLLTLKRVADPKLRLAAGQRFSALFIGAVGLLVVGAAMLAWGFIGSVGALIGTAYGIMTLAKVALLGVLLLLALGNKRSVAATGAAIEPALARLRRFAEVEIGIGVTVLFIASSLASQPPGIDQAADQASVQEIVARMSPAWPRLTSPSPEQLTQYGLEPSKVSEAEDQAWSEYNHNWAGIFVLAMGLLALAERSGKAPWARHWPLMFLVMAVGLLVRSDPESWPIGPVGFFESMSDPEVAQHRAVIFLLVPFGLFEWGVRTGRLTSERMALIFPILCAIGAALLLVHSHTLTDVKQRFLIEFTHIPMGLMGVLAGWARWLELRGTGCVRRFSGLAWPICFIMVGLLLLQYRES